MAKVRDYGKLATDILRAVGGESNIAKASHCATRLRLVLRETPEGAKEKVSQMPGVISVIENSGQFQVVIGTHVVDVFEHLSEHLHLSGGDSGGLPEKKQGVLSRVIATMSAVFAPFVYILAAAGILQGILILINLAYPAFAETGTYEVLSFMSWTPFTFLPIFIALTASKHFKCNTFIAVLCCSALVNPSWNEIAARIANGELIKFLAFPLSETVYTSSVLPPLFLVWLLSYVERFLEKRLPEVARPLLTPLICLVLMVPFTILLIGPLSTIFANAIANGYNSLVAVAPAVAGALIGGLWQVFVIFGVHWGITPVVLANFSMNGHDTFQAFQTIAVVAQMSAAFGCWLKSRNREFKGVALSAGITGVFGITEPAIYGVTLRLKKPFICGCISGAVGAVVLSFFNSAYYAYAGLPSLLTIVNAISPDAPMSFIGEVIGCLIAIIGSILLVYFVGFDDPVAAMEAESVEAPHDEPAAESANECEWVDTVHPQIVGSPLSGRIVPLSEVPDEAFRGGVLGYGVAIEPKEYKLFAPMDGVINIVAESGHAIGMTGGDVELLMHIGVNTVQLNGKYFTPHVKEGQQVKKGNLLLEFDGEAIKKAGYPLITPILVEGREEEKIKPCERKTVNPGDDLLTVQ